MIRTQGLGFTYTAKTGGTVLTFPDIDVPQGAVVLLTGHSGCGKSTWLGLVAGLMDATCGQLEVAAFDLAHIKGRAKDRWRAQHLGLLPQRLHLSAALTVTQNLQLALWAGDETAKGDAAIQEALQALGIEALAGRKPAQLSGGQAQRVALARAVLRQPKVILADEPTASLDDEAAQEAMALLLATAQRCAATLVIATHDSRVAPLLAGHTPYRLQLQKSIPGRDLKG